MTAPRALIIMSAAVLGASFAVSAPAEAGPLTCGSDIATIVGTEGDDVLTGTAGDDVIVGLGGSDHVDGLEGDDLICGGADSDVLVGGEGRDYLNGGSPTPLSGGQATAQEYWGGAGSDVIHGYDGGALEDEDVVHYDDAASPVEVYLQTSDGYGHTTGDGEDLLSNIDSVYGSAYDDSLFGRAPNQSDPDPDATADDGRLVGLEGDDVIVGLAGREEIRGGPGADLIEGGPDTDGLHGGAGADHASGGLGDGGVDGDIVLGGSGVDLLLDSVGADRANGGPESDRCSVNFESIASCELPVNEGPSTRVAPHLMTNTERSTSTLERSTPAHKQASRPLRPSELLRTQARPACQGEAATIVGTNARDLIVGTPKRDVIAARRGGDTIDGRGGHDVICGGRGGDLIKGGPGADELLGGADGVSAGEDDYVPDQMWGGAGDDLIDVGSSNFYPNPVHYENASAPIHMHGNQVSGQGDDRLRNVTYVIGTQYDDVLVDGPVARRLEGGLGNDRIVGLGGDDFLRGDEGDDDMRGGAGNDTLDGYLGNDRVAGGAGDDSVTTDSGANELFGGGGDDFLVAYDGASTLHGGPGDDSFLGGSGSEVVHGGMQRAGDVFFRDLTEVHGCEFNRVFWY